MPTRPGYTAMRWYVKAGPDRVWAVEGANGAGRPLAQRLVEAGERVVDVPAKLAARVRLFDTGHNRKTDAVDAHSIAMVAVRTKNLSPVAGASKTGRSDPLLSRGCGRRGLFDALARLGLVCRQQQGLLPVLRGRVPPLTGTPRVLRAINDRAALQLLLSHGALSRSQMGKLTGLSKPTAAELLARLHKDGLVVERGMTRGGRGPNAQLYAINERAAFVGAVDAAEDCVTVAVADITGQVKGETTSRVDFTAGADPVPVLRSLLSRAARRGGLTRRDLQHIVIGVPGVYDDASDSLAFSSHVPGWSEPSVIRRLRDSLGASLTIENDVNLAAVGERTRGVARDVEGFALLWVGEGLGLAIDIAGSLYRGATGGAGEIGYMPVLGTLRRAHARPASTLQDLVGSPAVLMLARDHGVTAVTAAEAVAIAAADHESQPRFLTELASRLATGLATIVAVLDPSLIVLSGTTSLAGGQRLTELVGAELSRVSPFRKDVVLSAVAGSPVLAGALEMALEVVRDELFGVAAVTKV